MSGLPRPIEIENCFRVGKRFVFRLLSRIVGQLSLRTLVPPRRVKCARHGVGVAVRVLRLRRPPGAARRRAARLSAVVVVVRCVHGITYCAGLRAIARIAGLVVRRFSYCSGCLQGYLYGSASCLCCSDDMPRAQARFLKRRVQSGGTNSFKFPTWIPFLF